METIDVFRLEAWGAVSTGVEDKNLSLVDRGGSQLQQSVSDTLLGRTIVENGGNGSD